MDSYNKYLFALQLETAMLMARVQEYSRKLDNLWLVHRCLGGG